jgi:hypothetical protein
VLALQEAFCGMTCFGGSATVNLFQLVKLSLLPLDIMYPFFANVCGLQTGTVIPEMGKLG